MPEFHLLHKSSKHSQHTCLKAHLASHIKMSHFAKGAGRAKGRSHHRPIKENRSYAWHFGLTNFLSIVKQHFILQEWHGLCKMMSNTDVSFAQNWWRWRNKIWEMRYGVKQANKRVPDHKQGRSNQNNVLPYIRKRTVREPWFHDRRQKKKKKKSPACSTWQNSALLWTYKTTSPPLQVRFVFFKTCLYL